MSDVRRSVMLDKALQNKQLHLKLGDMDLEEFVRQLAAAANRSLREAGVAGNGQALEVLRASLRNELRRFVVGCDVCGLGDLCRAGEEFDPWGQE